MHQKYDHKTNDHGGQPDKSQLAILHFHHAAKSLFPGLGRDQRQDAFDHQHQTYRQQQGGTQLLFTACAARVAHVLEEVGIRLQHHDIALALEAVAVSIQTAVEGIKLRVFTVSL